MPYSASIRGAAVTQVTRVQVAPASGDQVIKIPANKGGTLVAVEVFCAGTLETAVVGAGGKIDLECDTADWSPFEFYTNVPQELTATSGGAVFQKPFVIGNLNVPLAGGSNVKVWFTPFDNQSQFAEVTLFWTSSAFSGRQTYMKTAAGGSLTQATKATDNASIAVPTGKGGVLKRMLAMGVVTAAVVVGTDPNIGGGLVQLRNTTPVQSWEPTAFGTGAASVLVAGAFLVEPVDIPLALELPGNSTVAIDYTPYNDAAQILYVTAIWD